MSNDQALIRAKDREIEELKRRLQGLTNGDFLGQPLPGSSVLVTDVSFQGGSSRSVLMVIIACRLSRYYGSEEKQTAISTRQTERRNPYIRVPSSEFWFTSFPTHE